MTVHVFLGPSLPVEQARAVLDAQYHPPVSCGDVTELVLDREPPKAIVLVDGLFEQVPTVWHKEILFALERGVRVFGAASMGALRAAELAAFGMEGVGGIYERFASGEYQDDDEVTIVHAPAEDGYVPLSEAMANLRAGLAAALAAGAVTAATHDLLVDAAKRRFYPDRSWGGCTPTRRPSASRRRRRRRCAGTSGSTGRTPSARTPSPCCGTSPG
ncbi:TfuA-like protein [Kitasatospora arboriphila]